jgi:hypothetical protein
MLFRGFDATFVERAVEGRVGQTEALFDFQLEILRWELEYIEGGIRQMDEICTQIKNWAIVAWSGAMGIAIANQQLRPYLGFVFLIPLLFWLVDARWRKIQRGFIYRMNQIRTFVNGEDLARSFEQQELVNFTLLDPRAKASAAAGYGSYTSVLRALLGSTAWLYLGLIILSLLVHLIS